MAMERGIEPARLAIRLEPRIAAHKLDGLLEDMKDRGGVETYLEALRGKQRVFLAALPEAAPPAHLDAGVVAVLLDCVFPARRRLAEGVSRDPGTASRALLELVYAKAPLMDRMQAFCDAFPAADRKLRRCAWDWAAEVLHFRRPEAVPLMTRWVWDTGTMSGAVRQFVASSEDLDHLPLGATPEDLEAVRAWFVEHLTASGFYRDLPLITDLILARGYADYVRSVSGGLGILQGDFGARQDPMELVVKLLGIDQRRGERHAAASRTWH